MKSTKIITIYQYPDGTEKREECIVPEGYEDFQYNIIQDDRHLAIMEELKKIKEMLEMKWE